jgi:DNA polymerase III epsilon subunit family exonuclease
MMKLFNTSSQHLQLRFAAFVITGFVWILALPTQAIDTGSKVVELNDVVFASFDTETTGLSPSKDRVVELAVVRYQAGEILDQKTWLIFPERLIPYYATRAHGITDEMVKGQPLFADIVEEFEAYIEGTVMIAHNASFDINFINDEYNRLNRPHLTNQVIDSLRLFRSWFPGLDSYKLSSIAEHAQIKGDTFHRALADSVYVARLFDMGIKVAKPHSLNEVQLESGGPKTF